MCNLGDVFVNRFTCQIRIIPYIFRPMIIMIMMNTCKTKGWVVGDGLDGGKGESWLVGFKQSFNFFSLCFVTYN